MQIADMHYLPENERMSQKRGPCQKDLYNLCSSHRFSGNMLAIRRVSIDWLHCSSASQQYGPCFATIGSSFPLCIDIVGSIMLKAACSIGFNLHHSEVHTFRNKEHTQPNSDWISIVNWATPKKQHPNQFCPMFAPFFLFWHSGFAFQGFNSPRGHWFQRSWVGDQF